MVDALVDLELDLGVRIKSASLIDGSKSALYRSRSIGIALKHQHWPRDGLSSDGTDVVEGIEVVIAPPVVFDKQGSIRRRPKDQLDGLNPLDLLIELETLQPKCGQRRFPIEIRIDTSDSINNNIPKLSATLGLASPFEHVKKIANR